MLRPSVVRFVSGSLLVCLAFASCTPEAVLVDPPAGGSAGSGSPGGTSAADAGGEAEGGSEVSVAGSNSTGDAGDAGDAGEAGMVSAGGAGCAAISSDRPGCVECLAQKCAPQMAACSGNACTCDDWNGSVGQFNCLLDCPTFPGMKPQVDECSATCGFQDIMHMAAQTRALFDCLVQPPSGPLACDACAPAPPQ